MSSMRNNRDGQQYGKKIGELRIAAHENGPVTLLQLRFDQGQAKFSVQVGETWLRDKDLVNLKKRAQEELAKIDQIEYAHFIEVELEIHTKHGWSYDPEDESEIRGLGLKFRVLELSQPLKFTRENQYQEETYRLGREVQPHAETGKMHTRGRERNEKINVNEDELIPYTPEAYATLVAIHEGIVDLAKKLRLLLGSKDPALVAKNLITLGTGGIRDLPALPAPEPEPAPRKRPRARADQPAEVMDEAEEGDF